jgi:tripartite-type tricarboxylate transporter receptor subunit TctC
MRPTLPAMIGGCRLLVLLVAAGTAAAAHADAPYPARPVRFILAQAAGSSVDLLARLIGAKLSDAWGQPVIVENRPGANAIIGMELAARAKPDGYTLAMTVPSAMTINPVMYQSLPYRPLEDFAPITQTTAITFALVVNPKLAARSVAELIALAQARPGVLNYSSAGIGNQSHLAAAMFSARAGITLTHVPNKGETPALLDVISGETDLMFSTLPIAQPHIQSGELRLLALCSATRSPAYPDVPTMIEAGLPGLVIEGWTGIVAPVGVPAPIIDVVQRAVARVLASPDVGARLSEQGAAPVGSTPAAFAAFMRAETVKWSRAVEDAGLVGSQ